MQSINILFVFGRSLLEHCSLALHLSVKKKNLFTTSPNSVYGCWIVGSKVGEDTEKAARPD